MRIIYLIEGAEICPFIFFEKERVDYVITLTLSDAKLFINRRIHWK